MHMPSQDMSGVSKARLQGFGNPAFDHRSAPPKTRGDSVMNSFAEAAASAVSKYLPNSGLAKRIDSWQQQSMSSTPSNHYSPPPYPSRPPAHYYGYNEQQNVQPWGGVGGHPSAAPPTPAKSVLPPTPVEAGSLETRLVDEILRPGGIKIAPTESSLSEFIEKVEPLDTEVVALMLLAAVSSEPGTGTWQKKLRALYVLDAMLCPKTSPEDMIETVRHTCDANSGTEIMLDMMESTPQCRLKSRQVLQKLGNEIHTVHAPPQRNILGDILDTTPAPAADPPTMAPKEDLPSALDIFEIDTEDVQEIEEGGLLSSHPMPTVPQRSAAPPSSLMLLSDPPLPRAPVSQDSTPYEALVDIVRGRTPTAVPTDPERENGSSSDLMGLFSPPRNNIGTSKNNIGTAKNNIGTTRGEMFGGMSIKGAPPTKPPDTVEGETGNDDPGVADGRMGVDKELLCRMIDQLKSDDSVGKSSVGPILRS
eukprot:GHVO01039058.1.p1 GENE.GHVO01039058.1~~GHVO01039058.1.p1  ORF type:complete len:477 (-),score=125.65 GHVO01039058.1:141-1571(-)